MLAIRACTLPSDALLSRYAASGAYTDCYFTEIARSISIAQFIEAFYTTPVFKLERFILRLAVSRPSTDGEAAQLARGEISAFAAWSVEARTADQVLLADFTGRTKSWLRVEPSSGEGTRLFFGSAVVPVRNPKTGRLKLGPTFSALLGFHKAYSRTLLFAARQRLT